MKDTLMKLVGFKNETRKKKVEKPAPMALDKDSTFVYQSGSDVQKTWRKYGWTPPTEYRSDYEFAKNRESV
jgi:peptidyl-tRNA hydrolase